MANNFLKNTFEIHPFLFGIFTTIFIFTFNVHIVKIEDLILPLVIIVSIVIGLTIPIKILLKNKKKSAFIISIIAILFFSYGHFYEIIENYIYIYIEKYGQTRKNIYYVVFLIN